MSTLLIAAVLAMMTAVAPSAHAAAPPAPACPGGPAMLFEEQWYCPGSTSGVDRTAYGTGARIVLTDVTVVAVSATTARVSRCWTPGYFCGASLDSGAAVSLSGLAGRPDRGDILDVFGVTATGSLVATGYVTKGHTDLPPTSTDVSLRSRANNRYVVAENGGNAPLIANRTAIGAWEHFDLLELGSGIVALRAHANGRYVVAESGGASPLIANRTAIGLWEKFRLIRNPDGTVSLRSQANDRYVVAESAGAGSLIANRTAIGPWEKFDLIVHPPTPCVPDLC